MSELCLGTSGWSYDSWIGDFYPDGTRKSEMFTFTLTMPEAILLEVQK